MKPEWVASLVEGLAFSTLLPFCSPSLSLQLRIWREESYRMGRVSFSIQSWHFRATWCACVRGGGCPSVFTEHRLFITFWCGPSRDSCIAKFPSQPFDNPYHSLTPHTFSVAWAAWFYQVVCFGGLCGISGIESHSSAYCSRLDFLKSAVKPHWCLCPPHPGSRNAIRPVGLICHLSLCVLISETSRHSLS